MKKIWIYIIATATVIIFLNALGPFIRNNLVHEMEKLYTGIKANPGALEVVEATIGGKSNVPTGNEEVKTNTDQIVNTIHEAKQPYDKPIVEIPIDLKAEQGDQKNVDAGHSPWKLDPVFVTQVFVSLKISPEGIQGDYPVKYDELSIVKNNGKEAIVEVGGNKTPISRVYLKRLVRQDDTGIWTVIGYDPVNTR